MLSLLRGSDEAAQSAARAWLAGHAGDGRLGRSQGDDESEDPSADDAGRAAYVKGLLDYAQPPSQEMIQYLGGRNLDPVAAGAESQLRWLPGWRGEEGAMLAAITDDAGELVALQVTCITPDGQKSAIEPVRITLRGPSNWRIRGAFRLGSPEMEELVLVEGVEDAIAARLAGAERVHACLGVGALGRAQLPKNVTRTIVCRDDDTPGSEACKALGRGVGRILLQGRQAAVTPRAGELSPNAKDVNDLMKVNVELARLQLEQAASPQAMLHPSEKEALLDEISRASTDVYENGRLAVAAALGWRANVLDDDRRKRRQDRAKQGDDPVTQVEAKPWPDPVTDIGAVLNDAVTEVTRFLVAPDHYYDVIALWAAHTHLTPKAELQVEYTPRLGFQSPIHKCGKSTALKCVHLMSHNSRPAASISPSSIFRGVDAFSISIMVEEGDQVFKGANPELLAIMNAGADRMLAKVMRTEKSADGKFEPRWFNCFAPIAFTSIGQAPKTLQDRSIVLQMKRATKVERPKKLTVRTRGALIDIGRKFARWAADLGELPDPDLPKDLFNRIDDRWFVLFQIAGLAGGDWLERCRKAALADFAREEADAADGGPNGDLLRDVWEVFHASGKMRMFTRDICAALLALDESPWATANRGQPVDEYYLKANLRDFLPDNAETLALRRWREEKGLEARGYHELHFKDAFYRYLSLELPSVAQKSKQSGNTGEDSARGGGVNHPPHPSHPPQTVENYVSPTTYFATNGPGASATPSVAASGPKNRVPSATDAVTDGSQASVTNNSEQNQSIARNATDASDQTDIRQGILESNAPPSEKRNRKLRALDLYCGGGGAARGLMHAGFHVTGVDILPQKNYCGDAFVQMDALEYLANADLSQFDIIWASPPCQRYTSLRHAPGKHRDADLIAPTRDALIRAGKPWAIENVEEARDELRNPVLLCGSMFGLETHPCPDGWCLQRHRLFETSFPVSAPVCQHDERPVIGIYGGHFRDRRRATGTNHKPDSNVPTELGFRAMGKSRLAR